MKFPFASGLLSLACLFLSACSSSNVRSYYVLSASEPAPARGGVGIGVGPVDLAPYLTERQNLIFQSSPNQLEFSEDHLWAGDLEDDFTRVLASNLAHHEGTANVKVYPWQRESDLDYQVTLDVVRFQGTPDGETVLEANWRVYRLVDGVMVANENTTVRDDLRQDGFEEMAASLSRLVDRLAARIATAF
ncbi:PqiC family protein [Roseibacillus ishigakijimensis]|uniref:Membrane integrity-associated transporter subunit PqiC n=1 Tax=Roseibacillus ishigakijimensis TaxID=454146 RepID=A0A934RR09_9BACT|nr:PqiC family protein [Roseibacillus ishigakijimensis]MBK1834312.1 membrane integrity-associated transporter subunit PqiC [Roseibacillus ishigakijimensis]